MNKAQLLESLSSNEKQRLIQRAEERIAEKARNDIDTFIEYVIQDEDGGAVEQGDLHKEWQQLFETHEKLVIVAPRDHGKTTQVVARCLWEIGRNPNIRIKIVCQSDSNAKDRLQQVKQYIEDSDEYETVFPHVHKSKSAKDWTKHSITVDRDARSKDSTLEAWGVEASSTGGRADLIIFDDIVDESNALKHPSKRESIKTKFYNVWLNQLGPEDEMIYIGTRWHQDDLTGELLERDGYFSKVYAIDEDFTPLWPEKWDKEALKKRRNEIGARAFDLGYRNEPISLEERTFDEEALMNLQSSFESDRLRENHPDAPVYFGVDLAQSKRSAGSMTSIFVTKVIDSTRYVVDIRAGQWKTNRIVEEIVHLNQFWRPISIYVESNSFQETIIDWIRALSDASPRRIPVEGAFTSTNKMDLEMGVPALASEMRRGYWKASYNRDKHEDTCDSRQSCVYCKWYEELKGYPIAKSSDIVMSNWLCMQAIWDAPRQERDRSKDLDSAVEAMRRDGFMDDYSGHQGEILAGVRDLSVFH